MNTRHKHLQEQRDSRMSTSSKNQLGKQVSQITRL